MTFHLLHLENVPIFAQLQLEEALLRADNRNWCLINHGSPPAIVMGISGKPSELIDQRKMEEAPLPLIKRFSGGGTVVVDENTLFITFICEQNLHPFLPYPENILNWTKEFYQNALSLDGFNLQENDYVLHSRKCGGNAQYIRKERWLHHTTFLWSYQQALMEYLLLPQKRPSYRQDRPHETFLCSLKSHFPKKTDFFTSFTDYLCSQYSVEELSLDQVKDQLKDIPYRKTTQKLQLHDGEFQLVP
jgi:lipoate-protein ligase A